MGELHYDNPRHRKIGMKRLLKLADLLDTVPRNRFDYSVWAGDDYKGKANLSCGTVACALGWATTIPSLRDKRRCGLRLITGTGYVSVGIEDYDPCWYDSFWDPYWVAMVAFGLTIQEATLLFSPSCLESSHKKIFGFPGVGADGSAKDVARLIRKFVNHHGTEPVTDN